MIPEEEYHTSLLALTELLKYGTTTLLGLGSTKHIDACLHAYQQSGCRIIVGRHVVDRPNPLNLPAHDTAKALELTRSTVEAFDGQLSGRVAAWAMPFSAEYASEKLLPD
jgi:cytosine/adenosine deaminase-related metal-dependent hydrolase